MLENHPEVNITQVTGRSMAGKKLSEVFPFYNGNLIINDEIKESVDLIFSCLPHKASAEVKKSNTVFLRFLIIFLLILLMVIGTNQRLKII